jgi:hypothetical protein
LFASLTFVFAPRYALLSVSLAFLLN